MMKRVQHNFPVLDGEVFTMGKQVEKHGKVRRFPSSNHSERWYLIVCVVGTSSGAHSD